MFGIGMGEILLVCLVAIFFFGPDDFVKLARLAARGLREFRVFKHELKDSVEKTVNGSVSDDEKKRS
ncbi:MAG: twin-arginine translocase TatA/TatE family subunit [Candidatus Mycalebacterium zealandia]|nr:MAG: twin-arginine translocase TatA/TatE family subunit [Candidatus Mycalebacterium zealandia]